MCSADDPQAVKLIVKLWLNGESVVLRQARFEGDRATGRWRMRVWFGTQHPYEQRYGVSMEFEDGTTAHGRARLVDLGHDVVVFEGESMEEVAWRET